MHVAETNTTDTGLDVFDLQSDREFNARTLHARDVAMQMEGMRRLTRAFMESPDTVLQVLVDAAVQLCGADSAGMSMETAEGSDENFYQWVATSGEYARFLNASLPRTPSACGICLERGRPQLFRVRQSFFDGMGIEAPAVTDGILLPWEVEGTRGTIWIMAHTRNQAFDSDDSRMMEMLADFAAMAIRHQAQQQAMLDQTAAQATAALANELAHQINNPLQSLMNLAYLTAEGHRGGDMRALGRELTNDLDRLSVLVNKLLALPIQTAD